MFGIPLLIVFSFALYATAWTPYRGQIVSDTNDTLVLHLKGINWYGMETPTRVIEGLWAADLIDHVG